MIEAISRLIPDFMGKTESTEYESFSSYLIEHPHYTRPAEFMGYKVPEVLLSGNHKEIYEWRRHKCLMETFKYRPELLTLADLTPSDYAYLRENKSLFFRQKSLCWSCSLSCIK